jgi:hypothetical protein
VDRIDDVRRWATERTSGIMRLIVVGEALREDVEGAVADGDVDYAAYLARQLVLRALCVAGLTAGGDVDLDLSQTTFDWFDAVDAGLVARARDLALAVAGQRPADLAAWQAGVSDLLADAEARLDLGRPIPRLRSQDGMFGSLALTRDWLDLCAELGGPVAVIAAGE